VGTLNEAIAATGMREVVLFLKGLHDSASPHRRESYRGPGAGLPGAHRGPSFVRQDNLSKSMSIQLLATAAPISLEMETICGSDQDASDEQAVYYELCGALDVSLFNEHLLRLLDGRRLTLPSTISKDRC